jgi:hypothetical protein
MKPMALGAGITIEIPPLSAGSPTAVSPIRNVAVFCALADGADTVYLARIIF